MRTMIVDSRRVMLNEQEHQYWIDTGMFKRILAADSEDAEYIEVRNRMLANGDEAYYDSICPMHTPSEEPAVLRDKAERFQMYRRGWKHGAHNAAMTDYSSARPDLKDAYARGYSDGRDAHSLAMGAEARRLGYQPSILRGDDA